jgi:hypothetical protein
MTTANSRIAIGLTPVPLAGKLKEMIDRQANERDRWIGNDEEGIASLAVVSQGRRHRHLRFSAHGSRGRGKALV